MKAFIIFDENNYIMSLKTASDGVYDIDELDLKYINCYYLSQGKLLLDENKKAEIEKEDSDHDEIEDLKKKLNETDYIMAQWAEEILSLNNPLTWITDVIKINSAYIKKYAEALKNRKTWRERIKELGG